MKHNMITALVLAVTLSTGPVQANPPVPKTVAEAKEQMETSSRRPSYRTPPGNARAEDYRALFGNTVMLTQRNNSRWHKEKPDPNHPVGVLKIIYIGADGRYVWCSLFDDGKLHTKDVTWRPLKIRRGKIVYPLFDSYAEAQELKGISPLYDAETGETIWYTVWRGRWWDHNNGHLQEQLPASTWDLCPDFPSAEELGIGINTKQTAHTYDGILAQDPGRRIRRPDLVTPDPVEVRE